MSALFPLYVDGEEELAAVAAVLRANGFALRCDLEGRTVAHPTNPGLFSMVMREDLEVPRCHPASTAAS